MTFEQFMLLKDEAAQVGLEDHAMLKQLLHLLQAKELAKKQFRIYLSKMNDWEVNCAKAVRECIKERLELTEAVEMCPHCMGENVFQNYDVEKSGYKVKCQHCGQEIMLCDECRNNADFKPCNWQSTATGGKCYRGTTKYIEVDE